MKDLTEKKYNVNRILLIGGSSKLTLVKCLLNELLPNVSIDTCGEKDIAVALGNIAELQSSEGSEPEQEPEPFNEPLNLNKHMECPECKSNRCYKLMNRMGYHCVDCGWEGKKITVVF